MWQMRKTFQSENKVKKTCSGCSWRNKRIQMWNLWQSIFTKKSQEFTHGKCSWRHQKLLLWFMWKQIFCEINWLAKSYEKLPWNGKLEMWLKAIKFPNQHEIMTSKYFPPFNLKKLIFCLKENIKMVSTLTGLVTHRHDLKGFWLILRKKNLIKKFKFFYGKYIDIKI